MSVCDVLSFRRCVCARGKANNARAPTIMAANYDKSPALFGATVIVL
jgi:hypothetical protein